MTGNLKERFDREGIVLDLHRAPDRALLRKETNSFVDGMRRGRGQSRDIPRMYFSALVDRPELSRDQSDFKDAALVVISIGGTYTHFRALEIAHGRVWKRIDIQELKRTERIATPCGDGKRHALKTMLYPIAERAMTWIEQFWQEGKHPHILLNWGFPQQSIVLPPGSGITGALGQSMTKGQSGVRAAGQEIHAVFRDCLYALAGKARKKIDQMEISVQNDTVMAMYRYLGAQRRQAYGKMGLMILGTGTNCTTAESYFFSNDRRTVLTDSEGFPLRRNAEDALGLDNHNLSVIENYAHNHGISISPEIRSLLEKGQFDLRPTWVNYETGRLVPESSLTKCDRLDTESGSAQVPDIENLGLAGTGYARHFRRLVRYAYPHDDGNKWECICRIAREGKETKADPSAEWIIQLAGGHAQLSPLPLLGALASTGLTEPQCEELQWLAGIVIHRSALWAAEMLAAVSLFCGLGLTKRDKPDALAMEGSLWKTVHFQEKILEFANQLLEPELKRTQITRLNLELITEDNYNAGVLGPAYLLGQFQSRILN